MTPDKLKELFNLIDGCPELTPKRKHEIIHSLMVCCFIGNTRWYHSEYFSGLEIADLFEWASTIQGYPYWEMVHVDLRFYLVKNERY